MPENGVPKALRYDISIGQYNPPHAGKLPAGKRACPLACSSSAKKIQFPGRSDPTPRLSAKPRILENVAVKPNLSSLEDLWPLQAELNARIGIDTLRLGQSLNDILRSGEKDSPAAENLRLEVGRALKNYLDALAAECHELQECLSWKHWYAEARQGRQYQLHDLQNARVEAIDMLFFWISLCQLLGLSPADVYRLYEKKLGLNHRRQEENRTQAEHESHEAENRTVV